MSSLHAVDDDQRFSLSLSLPLSSSSATAAEAAARYERRRQRRRRLQWAPSAFRAAPATVPNPSGFREVNLGLMNLRAGKLSAGQVF